MMYAFSRDRAVPGHQLWSKVATNRVPRNAVWAIVVLAGILMVPAIWNYLVGYGVGTAIAVIGLYIAFVLPVILRFRMDDEFVHGAWSLGRHYKWIDLLSLAWVALITILFIFPLYKAGLPWEDDFTWDLTNYTILWFAAIGIVFGGWWVISAKNWFKGPVRQGTEEELERIEAAARARLGRCSPSRRSLGHRATGGAPRRPSASPHPGAAVLVDRLAGDAARVG